MFLALNEIYRSKLRYILVVGVMLLIAYLVFFLTGLSYGLAQKYQTSINKWGANNIILSSSANYILNTSEISQTDYTKIKAANKAALLETPAVIFGKSGTSNKINVSFFGINANGFLKPNLSSGRIFKGKNEVVVDNSLKSQYHFSLGETIKLSGNNQKLKIVGFTNQAEYTATPVLYMSYQTYQNLKVSPSSGKSQAYNAVITKGKLSKIPSGLDKLTISQFVYKLPGFNAQVLTFGFMIGFLVVIAAVVIGIFIYVLTMQKISIFGIMKAQGIPNSYISKSVVAQTFFLALFGVALGLIMALGTALILPQAVPFQVNTLFFIGISSLMVGVAVLGSLFSITAILKIDPLKAIS